MFQSYANILPQPPLFQSGFETLVTIKWVSNFSSSIVFSFPLPPNSPIRVIWLSAAMSGTSSMVKVQFQPLFHPPPTPSKKNNKEKVTKSMSPDLQVAPASNLVFSARCTNMFLTQLSGRPSLVWAVIQRCSSLLTNQVRQCNWPWSSYKRPREGSMRLTLILQDVYFLTSLIDDSLFYIILVDNTTWSFPF